MLFPRPEDLRMNDQLLGGPKEKAATDKIFQEALGKLDEAIKERDAQRAERAKTAKRLGLNADPESLKDYMFFEDGMVRTSDVLSVQVCGDVVDVKLVHRDRVYTFKRIRERVESVPAE